MRKIKIEDAIGEALCHDMTAILEDGYKGVKFHRGHVITEADLPALRDMGKNQVFVWEPEADEVHEDDAATALAQAMCGEGLICKAPSEGKVQINAARRGLFKVNSAALREINSVPDYTVASIWGDTPVEEGEKIAGARIVPLVTKRENVEKAVKIAKENFPVFEIKPYKSLRVGVVITGSEVYYGRIKDAFEPVLTPKLQKFGAELLGFTKCPDDLEMIEIAVGDFLKRGAQLILLTGGMSVDPDDVTPTAIRNTGAELITQGFPMQPGNMLTVAYLGDTALVGVPGASMHSPTTSLDVFLPRIFAGEKITREEVALYGEGGFCRGCKACVWPLCSFGKK